MATHLRMAAVTWLVAAPVIGAGVAGAAPIDMPLSPSVSGDTGGASSGTSRPGLPSVGDLGKAFGGLTTAATTVGTGALSGFGVTPSPGQQLTPKFGDGRNGSNISSATSSSSTSAGLPASALSTTQSAPASEPVSIAESPAAVPSVQSVSVPLAAASAAAGQTALVVADAPLAPVTALTGPLPAALGEPIRTVAALPGFAVAQALPVVQGWASAVAELSSAVTPTTGVPRVASVGREFGGRVQPPASSGAQTDSRFAGYSGVSGQLPVRGPEPADRVFAADNAIVAAAPYRAGYSDDLRAAGLGEVAAVAVPGFTGLLVLTGAGGLIGFRQARAGRAMHGGTLNRFAAQ
ncbi:hypothetical protein [Mycolicibacterium mucogenicum]|uniref:Uncharacterized protein n=1 Tax=Mycolicibacterium mucogenicum DSM 44124 TaxID=1226753 RepID=A0A8H2JG28_MYCMU|nr:hypothetical protein [Mycolicibacterium mucogenicum]KAB7755880.1 hypothetical protein MMUC44124_19405 [Mycolicibacterium mucogenicum DSM 44124]QPG68392.1 hypothetical protein C1S78_023435 [Mycolicibacterium mucogenicum DSM 44124]